MDDEVAVGGGRVWRWRGVALANREVQLFRRAFDQLSDLSGKVSLVNVVPLVTLLYKRSPSKLQKEALMFELAGQDNCGLTFEGFMSNIMGYVSAPPAHNIS